MIEFLLFELDFVTNCMSIVLLHYCSALLEFGYRCLPWQLHSTSTCQDVRL